MSESETLIKPQAAAKALGVLPKTLARWADEGYIACIRTRGGQRRYAVAEVNRILTTPFPPDRTAAL